MQSSSFSINLPLPAELDQLFPLSALGEGKILNSRQRIVESLQGKGPFLVIVGPCSIHDLEAARCYSKLLLQLQQELSSCIKLVMRCYFGKARTQGGWSGFFHQEFISQKEAFIEFYRFFIELAEQGLPIAAEMINPLWMSYFGKFLSWGAIGARTAHSQLHRQLASALNFPVGFKNCVTGTILPAIRSLLAANESQVFLTVSQSGRPTLINSTGNPAPHLVLRGGPEAPNFYVDSLHDVQTALKHYAGNQFQHYLIDCAHDNSRKCPDRQVEVLHYLIERVLKPDFAVAGVMLESFLGKGRTDSPESDFGVSITDPCMDWEATRSSILALDRALHEAPNYHALKHSPCYHFSV